jgi:hypothetical protein
MSSIDVGAIVRSAGEEYLSAHPASADQCKALRAVAACRTERLGGERQQCDRCGFEHMLWRSCRNRHCPRCQAGARADWLEQRREELLPVPYFHVVFTVPEKLNVLARWAPRVFYHALFQAAGQALLDVGRSKLNIEVGALCVLHTWGQTLVLHPHIHCVVPGGGFAAGGAQWRSVRKPSFFLPVKVLSRRFRTLLCEQLREQWRERRLSIPAHILANAGALEMLLVDACKQEWVVYSKPPFGGPQQVLAYLAGYTHRIAISNRRLVAFDGRMVSFRYRDYRDENRGKTMTLPVAEFLRRFLQHVVPSRFVRIRYYGYLANRVRRRSLARARELLRFKPPARITAHAPVTLCPRCQQGQMLVTEQVQPQRPAPIRIDSS